jgi:hypothetical protein
MTTKMQAKTAMTTMQRGMTMDDTGDLEIVRAAHGPAIPRDGRGRFLPGGPGRPPGALNKASTRVSQAILADFEANKAVLLPRLRQWFVPQYVSLVGRLLARPEAGAGGADGADACGDDAAGDQAADELTLAAIRAAASAGGAGGDAK